MQLPTLNLIFTNETVHAVFRTLVHSLWQGMLVAMIAGAILIFTKRSRSALRYNLLNTTLLLFIFCNACTFYFEMRLVLAYGTAGKTTPVANIAENLTTISSRIHTLSITQKILSFFRSNEDSIVVVWLLIVIVKCMQLLAGLRGIYKLRTTQAFDSGEYWNNRLKELAASIGVQKPVLLLKSAIATIPMVAGHFKPVILFPATLLTTLPQREIEAILLHELAHIRRKDYLVNLLQSFAGIIFFFNPAVLWILSLIKDERENCCDDIAIREVKNKNQFIHALISFQEYNVSSGYASAFPGNKNHLVNRVKRIITNNNKTLNSMERIFLATGILITGFVMVALSQTKQPILAQKEIPVEPVHSEVSVKSVHNEAPLNSVRNEVPVSVRNLVEIPVDTVPNTEKSSTSNERSVINTSINGKQYRLVEQNGKVVELYVDNVRIPDEKIPQYNSVINTIHQDMEKQRAALKKQQAELQQQEVELKQKALAMQAEAKKQSDEMKLQQKELLAQSKVMQEKQQLMMEEEIMKQADQMKLQQKELLAQANLMKEKQKLMQDNFQKQAEQMKMQQKEMEIQADLMKEKQKLMQENLEKNTELMKKQQKELDMKAEAFEKSKEEMKLKMMKAQEEMQQQAEKLKQQQQEFMKQSQQSKPSMKDSTNHKP